MKNSELRIGNLVAYTTHPAIIKSITLTRLGFERLKKGVDAEFEREISDHNFTGIPLSSVWLQAFGFINQFGAWQYMQPEFDGFALTEYSEDFELTLNDSLVCRVKYVHQLQNIFHSLTQTDLLTP